MRDIIKQKIQPLVIEWMAALDQADAAIFLHDKAGRILHCNIAYRRHAGLTLKQIVGRRYFDIYPKTHAPVPGCLSTTDGMAAEGAAYEVQVGSITFRSCVCTMADEHGANSYCAHLLEDITLRRRIERELSESGSPYRRLFESVEVGTMLIDADTGTVVDANSFVLELLSCSVDACVGKKIWELVNATGLPRTAVGFRKLLAAGSWRYDHALIQAGGGKPVEVELFCPSRRVGKKKLIQCNFHDISGPQRVQALLASSQNILQSVCAFR